MQIHVSNLHTNLIEADVQRLFLRFGEVESIRLMRDKLNNRSCGRAYVKMPVDKEAVLAISGLNGSEVKGKRIIVEEIVYNPAPSNMSRDGSQDY